MESFLIVVLAGPIFLAAILYNEIKNARMNRESSKQTEALVEQYQRHYSETDPIDDEIERLWAEVEAISKKIEMSSAASDVIDDEIRRFSAAYRSAAYRMVRKREQQASDRVLDSDEFADLDFESEQDRVRVEKRLDKLPKRAEGEPVKKRLDELFVRREAEIERISKWQDEQDRLIDQVIELMNKTVELRKRNLKD